MLHAYSIVLIYGPEHIISPRGVAAGGIAAEYSLSYILIAETR